MNYGRYFRLNQALSKVVSGVAIYDYIDLPAYFGPSIDNPMSPKYPINISITSDSVCFRLHYSAFKIDEKEDFDQILSIDGKKRKIEKNFPHYAYDKDDIDDKSTPKIGDMGLTNISMAHLEEIILELPFAQVSSNKLSDTIKDIYNTRFPQVVDENTSMGGRFLEQLIKKRYSLNDEQFGGHSIENDLHKKMRKIMDNTASYSTLWLMDLMKDGRINLYTKDKYKSQNPAIVGFLRKLMLDFMFDLKHSDVFQNSTSYQKMYSGLMSDFYFSALMHKCEYYYYRKLLGEAINDIVLDSDTKTRISHLYGEELFKAESLWIKDIMSPQAEVYFGYKIDSERWYHAIFENNKFRCWPSWFADPEEEMRRVCFKTEDLDGELHVCCSDTAVECLNLEKDKDEVVKKMVESRNKNRISISQWFLKRYDFNDLFHLHLFENANLLFSLALLGLVLYFFKAIPEDFDKQNILGIIIISSFLGLILFGCWLGETYAKYNNPKWSILAMARVRLVWKRVLNVIIGLLLLSIAAFCFMSSYTWEALFSVGVLGVFSMCGSKIGLPPVNAMSNLHLALPRLVSAITAAWLTISLGFDIYVSFFDSEPSWPTAIAISLIVLGFIMYEINRIMPRSTSVKKIFRSLELLMFSYCISLVVGLVVINFVGEKFLERGGTLDDFYEQYVDFKGYEGLHGFDSYVSSDSFVNVNDLKTTEERLAYLVYQEAPRDTTNYARKMVDSLNYVFHSKRVGDKFVKTKDYPVVEKIPIAEGKYHLFLMRDFLIMFSFIAMFWGIFIQMIFTGEKQMTEL